MHTFVCLYKDGVRLTAQITQCRWPMNETSIGYLWQDTDRAKLKLWEKNLSHCHFSITSTLRSGLGLNVGLTV